MSAAKQAVCAIGIPEHIVQLAIDIQRLDKGCDFTDVTQLFAAADEIASSEEIQVEKSGRLKRLKALEKLKALRLENRMLKERELCRACRSVKLAVDGITFLPCGHFITCDECSEKFDECPACGKEIMATVRTFLS